MEDEYFFHFMLTFSDLKKLVDILNSHWDRGPQGEGWQSEELQRLTRYFESKIKEIKK